MKKSLSILLVLVIALGMVAGCSSSSELVEKENPVKVAGLFAGPISDMGWNATSYKGLKMVEELGAEISFVESVEISSMEEVLRNYAENGYQLVYANSDMFQDAVEMVSPAYPDVRFVIINGRLTTDNVNSFQIADEEQGFLMGVVSALMTETNKVSFIGGMRIPPIENGQYGFEDGVAYIDPDIETVSAYTGDFVDAAQAKGLAQAMIADGVDVLAPMADIASLGALEGAQESGVYAVAPGLGQEEVAPDATLIAVVKDFSVAYKVAYELFLSEELEQKIYSVGVKDGIITLSDWNSNLSDLVPEDVKNKVKEIYQKMVDGEIVVEKVVS